MMVRTAGPERMLTDDERALLELLARAPSPMHRYAALACMVKKLAGKWTWEYRAISAPRMYDTKREATEMLLRYVAVLEDAAQAERDRTYQARPSDG